MTKEIFCLTNQGIIWKEDNWLSFTFPTITSLTKQGWGQDQVELSKSVWGGLIRLSSLLHVGDLPLSNECQVERGVDAKPSLPAHLLEQIHDFLLPIYEEAGEIRIASPPSNKLFSLTPRAFIRYQIDPALVAYKLTLVLQALSYCSDTSINIPAARIYVTKAGRLHLLALGAKVRSDNQWFYLDRNFLKRLRNSILPVASLRTSPLEANHNRLVDRTYEKDIRTKMDAPTRYRNSIESKSNLVKSIPLEQGNYSQSQTGQISKPYNLQTTAKKIDREDISKSYEKKKKKTEVKNNKPPKASGITFLGEGSNHSTKAKTSKQNNPKEITEDTLKLPRIKLPNPRRSIYR